MSCGVFWSCSNLVSHDASYISRSSRPQTPSHFPHPITSQRYKLASSLPALKSEQKNQRGRILVQIWCQLQLLGKSVRWKSMNATQTEALSNVPSRSTTAAAGLWWSRLLEIITLAPKSRQNRSEFWHIFFHDSVTGKYSVGWKFRMNAKALIINLQNFPLPTPFCLQWMRRTR